MFDGQMEMSFGRIERVDSRGQNRQNRAQWWFRRMRQIVDLATDWRPTPPPRPVQIWFPVAENRREEVQVLQHDARLQTNERQICE